MKCQAKSMVSRSSALILTGTEIAMFLLVNFIQNHWASVVTQLLAKYHSKVVYWETQWRVKA